MWKDLNMKLKSEIMKMFIDNGISDLNDIKLLYDNSLKEGYLKWKQQIQLHKSLNIDKDDTYDYLGFYYNNPIKAYDMLKLDSDAHFTDEYKTSKHPSFSNESIYSGKVSKFNPKGIIGGLWEGNNKYILSQSLIDNNWDLGNTLEYLSENEPNGILIFMPNGDYVREDDGTRLLKILPEVNIKANKFDQGGDLNENNLIYELNPVDNSLFDFNDKFLYHRDFADVYQKPDGKRYLVYTEDDLPTVTSNRARRNLETPLWEHILKQYARNPEGMKTIEDAVTWGGNVAGASLLAAGTAPAWLPYVAPAASMVGRVGKLALLGLDWLFNPTTYRGALLSSYVGAEGIDNFRKNPNIETGIEAGLGVLPVSSAFIKGGLLSYNTIKEAYNTIKNSNIGEHLSSLLNKLYRGVYRPLTFPIRNNFRKHVTRMLLKFNYNTDYSSDELFYNGPMYRPYIKQYQERILNDLFGNTLRFNDNIFDSGELVVASKKLTLVNPQIRKLVSLYKTDFLNLIGEDGVVGGSTRGIAGGYINGRLNNDTEIITTKLRAEALKKKLGFQLTRENSIGGLSGTSPYAKGNTNLIEFDFIDESPNGFATGTQAHSIYSVLHPEERAKIISNKILTTDKFNPIRPDDVELPISAEALYLEFQKAPEEIKDLVHIVDMLGAGVNSASEANATKHAERAWNLLLSLEHPQLVSKAINILGKKWFGSAYKIPSEEYYNLKFDDVLANKEFINNIINITDKKIPDDYIDVVANNPKLMKNLFNYWYQNNLVTHRLVGIPNEQFTPKQTWDALFNLTHSVGGGTGSGVGRNNTSGKQIAFREGRDHDMVRGTTLTLITFHPEEIKNLSQFTKKFLEISDPNIINDFSIYKSYSIDLVKPLTPELEADILLTIHSLDRPIVRSMTDRRNVGAYNGSYVGVNYPLDFDPVLGQRPSVVSYHLSPEFGFAFSPQFKLYVKDRIYGKDGYFLSINDADVADKYNADRIKKITEALSDPERQLFFRTRALRKNHTITKLKELGFNIEPAPSRHLAFKGALKYINTFLPNGKVSIKTLKKIDPSSYLFQDLVEEVNRGKDIRNNLRNKYLELWHKLKDFNDNSLINIKASSGALLPLSLLGTYIGIKSSKKREDYKNLIESEILNLISPEYLLKYYEAGHSKKDIVEEILNYYDGPISTITDNNKDYIVQSIVEVLLDNKFKFKESSKYNKLKEK